MNCEGQSRLEDHAQGDANLVDVTWFQVCANITLGVEKFQDEVRTSQKRFPFLSVTK